MKTVSMYSNYIVPVLLLDVAFPLLLMLYGICPAARSKVDWGGRLWLATGFAAFLVLIVPLCFMGFGWRAAVLGGLAGCLAAGFWRIAPSPLGTWRVVLAGATLVAGAAFWGIAVWAIAGYFRPAQMAELEFPMRDGLYCVVNGGGSLCTNLHKVPNQYYGLDIVRVTRCGKWAEGVSPFPDRLADYPTFGTDLYSPADGVVLNVGTKDEDCPPGRAPEVNTAGNYILLGHGPYKILMGHLKAGSIRVRIGDQVARGQILAQLGNSGMAQYPHLHLSVATGGKEHEPYDGQGTAALYDGRFLVRNSLFLAKAAGGQLEEKP